LATTITAEYIRTVSEPGSFSSTKVRGSVELVLPVKSDWEKEWGVAYSALRAQVDAAVGELPVPTPARQPTEQTSSDSPAEKIADATTEVSQSAEIVPGASVEYHGCKVFFTEHKPATSNKKEYRRIRIGNPDILRDYGFQYVNAKSFVPSVLDEIKQIRKDDLVDVTGTWDKPWSKRGADGSEEMQYDIILQSVTRS